MLGHHKDDVIENIFNNVCRGRNLLDLPIMFIENKIDQEKLNKFSIQKEGSDYFVQIMLVNFTQKILGVTNEITHYEYQKNQVFSKCHDPNVMKRA